MGIRATMSASLPVFQEVWRRHEAARPDMPGEKCARCRQAIQSDPAFADQLWFHRTYLDEGTRALQRAQYLAACFGGAPADVRTSEGYDAQELQQG